ncbi:hypothetical protein ACWEKR_33550 [Nocardia sp. NPDC004573]
MAAPDVWMQVSSSPHGDPAAVNAEYSHRIDKVVVTTGSGSMFMTVPVAVDLLWDLAAALEDAVQCEWADAGLNFPDWLPRLGSRVA